LRVKDELEVPVGCGAYNAISTWRGLKTKMGQRAVEPSIAAFNAVTSAIGADFILYGL
jgi:tetrahydromethanopterin S-methyltransferase subunit H